MAKEELDILSTEIFKSLYEYVENQSRYYKGISNKADYDSSTISHLSSMSTAFDNVKIFMDMTIAKLTLNELNK